jgi:hypothetical protein
MSSHLTLLDLIAITLFGEQHRAWRYSLFTVPHPPVTSFLLGLDITSALYSETRSIRYFAKTRTVPIFVVVYLVYRRQYTKL